MSELEQQSSAVSKPHTQTPERRLRPHSHKNTSPVWVGCILAGDYVCGVCIPGGKILQDSGRGEGGGTTQLLLELRVHKTHGRIRQVLQMTDNPIKYSKVLLLRTSYEWLKAESLSPMVVVVPKTARWELCNAFWPALANGAGHGKVEPG